MGSGNRTDKTSTKPAAPRRETTINLVQAPAPSDPNIPFIEGQLMIPDAETSPETPAADIKEMLQADQPADTHTQLSIEDAVSDYDWRKPIGPEATEAEIQEWAGNDAMLESARQVLNNDDPSGKNHTAFAPRRALEGLLAAQYGEDPAIWAQANAHRPWAELMAEAEGLDSTMHGGVRAYAASLEQQWRTFDTWMQEYGAEHGTPQQQALWNNGVIDPSLLPDGQQRMAQLADYANDSVATALLQKQGPGALSGNISDYSRPELRKLLGFLEREAKQFSDDELRSMVLDAGLVPKWQGPAHAKIAADYLQGREGMSEQYRKRLFQRIMRTPYNRAQRLYASQHSDSNERPYQDLVHDMANHHPYLRIMDENIRPSFLRDPSSTVRHATLREWAQTNTVPTTRNSDERQAVASEAKYITPLQAQFGDAFDSFTQQFVEHGAKPNIRYIKKGTGKGRNPGYGSYQPSNGDIHIHSRLCKVINDAKKGKAAPNRIEDAASTMAHELLHGSEGRDEGNANTNSKRTKTIEHTVDEGGTEALARLHTEDMAQRMGLWDPATQGSLRDHATQGSYTKEVETMIALTAACNGEFDPTVARDGGYKEPEVLSPKAQSWLRDTYLQRGVRGRIEHMQQVLQQRSGKDEAAIAAELQTTLRECKQSTYTWRTARVNIVPDEPRYGKHTTYVAPEADFSASLTERIQALLS